MSNTTLHGQSTKRQHTREGLVLQEEVVRTMQRGHQPGEEKLRQVPVDVVVLVGGVQLQLKASQCVVDHGLQRVVQHPGAQASQVATVRFCLDQQAVQVGIHLVGLWAQYSTMQYIHLVGLWAQYSTMQYIHLVGLWAQYSTMQYIHLVGLWVQYSTMQYIYIVSLWAQYSTACGHNAVQPPGRPVGTIQHNAVHPPCQTVGRIQHSLWAPVSYTHLTLPTTRSV